MGYFESLGRRRTGRPARIRRIGENSGATETVEKDENVRENRVVKFVIVILVFPILVLVFHLLLTIVPFMFVGSLLVHFGRNPTFWAKILAVVTLLPACWGAVAVCKWIWPRSK